MAYKPSLGSRTYTNLSGSGTLQAVGATTLGGTLNVTGAVTLEGPTSGSAAGPGSYLALNSSGLVVLDTPGGSIRTGRPLGCGFTSSIDTQIAFVPTGIDDTAIIPIISGSSLLNVTITTTITASTTASNGVGGMDVGSFGASQGYYSYVVTKANAEDPQLLLSQDPTSPTLPAGYTYKSQALMFIRSASDSTIRDYDFRSDGWTFGYTGMGVNLKNTGTNAVDATNNVPWGGRFKFQINGRWNQNNNRTLTVYKNVNQTEGQGANGVADQHESVSTFRQNTNGTGDLIRDWLCELTAPPSGATETFYYGWNASMAAGSTSDGADFYATAWKTEAFCNAEE